MLAAMSYNDLWAVAYAWASNAGMSLHRMEHFAADYAHFFTDHETTPPCKPANFVVILATLDYHYIP